MTDENITEVPFGSFMQAGDKVFETPGSADLQNQQSESILFGSPPPQETSIGQTPGFGPFGGSLSTNTQDQQSKYKIFDLFWLINPKFYEQKQPIQSEAHVAIISYNVDFGNLRLTYYHLTKDSIIKNLIFYENLKRLVSGTIYPAAAFNICNSTPLSMTCMEQLFKQTGESWQQERPVCTAEKQNNALRFTISDPKYGKYFYDFTNSQFKAFLYACNFVYTEGFRLMGQKKLI
jgi:hypothetical protein